MNLSVFPNGIDTFVEHYDIQPSDLPHIRRYQELKQKSYLSVEEQNELTNLTSRLREKIFLADDFNKLQDCITNLETFFRDETQGHLDEFKKDIADTAEKTLGEIIQAGEDYISTSLHHFTTWSTTAGKKDYNIFEGSETLQPTLELDFQEEIMDLYIDGDVLIPTKDYVFATASNGKKHIVRLSDSLASLVVNGQKLVAKWSVNAGKLYINHSHEHKKGGKDELTVDMEMLSEDVRLAIGDTAQIDAVVKELEQVKQGLTGKSDNGHKHTKADITDFPTSLPANGGNADTVGGKNASQFASSSHDHAGVYAPNSHSHGNYSTTDHTHSQYAPSSHTHAISNISGLQGEIDNLKSSVSSGKTQVANAITAKGVNTATNAEFATMATNISKIVTGLTDAQKRGVIDRAMEASTAVRVSQKFGSNVKWFLGELNISGADYAFFISYAAQKTYPDVSGGTRVSQGSADDYDTGCNWAIYKKTSSEMRFSGTRKGDWGEASYSNLIKYLIG